MNYIEDLKVEFKGESFGSTGTYHILMYRISPNQNLNYHEEHSFLGFKYKVKKKIDTSWHRAVQYLNYPLSKGNIICINSIIEKPKKRKNNETGRYFRRRRPYTHKRAERR